MKKQMKNNWKEYNRILDTVEFGFDIDKDKLKSFISDLLVELVEQVIEQFTEKDGESGWSRSYNERFLEYLEALKSEIQEEEGR